MINKEHARRYCKDDITLIENYNEASSDETQTWDCHHRRETIYTVSGLQEIGEYYNRPACELIFLPRATHLRLHRTGKKQSQQTSERKSKALKGRTFSEKWKSKLKAAKKGKNNPAFGLHWYNNGVKNVRAKECPSGYKEGRR